MEHPAARAERSPRSIPALSGSGIRTETAEKPFLCSLVSGASPRRLYMPGLEASAARVPHVPDSWSDLGCGPRHLHRALPHPHPHVAGLPPSAGGTRHGRETQPGRSPVSCCVLGLEGTQRPLHRDHRKHQVLVPGSRNRLYLLPERGEILGERVNPLCCCRLWKMSRR